MGMYSETVQYVQCVTVYSVTVYSVTVYSVTIYSTYCGVTLGHFLAAVAKATKLKDIYAWEFEPLSAHSKITPHS